MYLGDQAEKFPSVKKAVSSARNFALKRLAGAACAILVVVKENHFPDEQEDLEALASMLNDIIKKATEDDYWKCIL